MSELFLLAPAAVAFIAAILSGFRPVWSWEIRTEAALDAVMQRASDGDFEGMIRFPSYAPHSHVLRLVGTFIQHGRASADGERLSLFEMHRTQRAKLAVATLVVAPTVALCIYAVASGVVFWPLIGSSIASSLLIYGAWTSISQIARDCDYVLGPWVQELSAKVHPDIRPRIHGLLA